MGNGMNKILPGIYVGNFRDAKDDKQLTENGITHILSIHDNPKELVKGMKYLCIKASDNSEQSLTNFFPQCIYFIHKARLKEGHVLIHCLAGVSRSVTVTAAYIMTVTDCGWRDAMNVIRGARNCANPNFNFQKQLQNYENEGLAQAKKDLNSNYPANPFSDSDNKECQALLKCHRHFVTTGENKTYAELYSLPHNAYVDRNKKSSNRHHHVTDEPSTAKDCTAKNSMSKNSMSENSSAINSNTEEGDAEAEKPTNLQSSDVDQL